MFFNHNSGISWIVVFLGNPGEKYADTRHNVGFMTAEAIAGRMNININRLRFRALTAACSFDGEKALLMKPQTFMNLSGEAVAPAAAFYKVPGSRVLVISDDTELKSGSLRIRRKGSHGGHNGLKSIAQHLGTDEFPRIKIGIGRPENPGMDMIDWVIGPFGKDEFEPVKNAVHRAADAVSTYITQGPDAAMNKFNG